MLFETVTEVNAKSLKERKTQNVTEKASPNVKLMNGKLIM